MQLLNTLFMSLSSLGNVAIILVMIYFVYSVGTCPAPSLLTPLTTPAR
jgi:hypothetical protein